MAGVKISELTALETAPGKNDLMVIVDQSETSTKKITIENLLSLGTPVSNQSKEINVSSTNEDANFYLTFVGIPQGADSVSVDTDLRYNASTNILSSPKFSGDGSLLTGISADRVKEISSKLVDSDAKHYLMLRTNQIGFDSVSTVSTLSYDPFSDTLSCTNFSGDGSLLTNVSAATSSVASAVSVTETIENANYFVHMGSTLSGEDNVNANAGLKFNPFTQNLTLGSLSLSSWDVKQNVSNQSIDFLFEGVVKARLDTSGNLFLAGTLTESFSF